MSDRRSSAPLRVILVYLGLALVWIVVGDPVVSRLIGGGSSLPGLVVAEDALFVVGSALLLYWLVGREHGRWEESEDELEEARDLLDAVVEGTSDAIFAKDREGRYLLTNEAGARLVGRSVEEVVGNTDEDLFPLDVARQVQAVDRRVMETGESVSYVEEITGGDGEPRILDTLKAPLRDGDEIVGVVGISRDVTERQQVERALERTEEKYRTLFDAAPMGVSVSRLQDGRFLEVNEGFEELLGYGRDELLGRSALVMGMWVEPEDRHRLLERVRGGAEGDAVDARLRRRDGEILEARVSGELLTLDGDELLLAVTRDVTEERRFERQLERMALHDGLTGLANRTLFRDRLEHALASAERNGTVVGVLFVDLDRFKVVNDTLGHLAGDRVLEEAAVRLASSFREGDTVARLGGDEFGVVLEGLEAAEEVEQAARRLVGEFEVPFRSGDEAVHLSASVGIAVSSQLPTDPDDLLRFSDIAMYRAKQEQGSTWRLFDPDLDAEASRRLHVENELRRAIEEEAFELHYQPVVHLPSGRIVGAEALIRWVHPERGLVPPEEFVPTAEEAGLVVPMGEWVIRTACREVAGWDPPRPPRDGFQLGINVSARQLQAPDAAERLEALVTETGLEPDRVVFEITESAVLRNREAIQALRDLGIRVALDDLGTGYASLEYLTQLEVDLMKVDRVFVAGIGRSVRDEAIVEAAAHIARRLGAGLVAEGIETEAQLARLRELEFDFGQGFLFSEPLVPDAFGRLLEEDPAW